MSSSSWQRHRRRSVHIVSSERDCLIPRLGGDAMAYPTTLRGTSSPQPRQGKFHSAPALLSPVDGEISSWNEEQEDNPHDRSDILGPSTLNEVHREIEDSNSQPTTTRRELWAYYLYYNGNNGVGPLSYSLALFQSALLRAGIQPAQSAHPGQPCIASSACVVPWPFWSSHGGVAGNGMRAVSSIMLLANGLCFAVMTVLFAWLGAAADFEDFGRWMLLGVTVGCWAAQYGFLRLGDRDAEVKKDSPDAKLKYGVGGRRIRVGIQRQWEWKLAMVLYIISYVCYGATLVFYSAIFPRLARYMPHVREAREGPLKTGMMLREEYEALESLERNHISSISTAHSNLGYLMTLLMNLSVLIPMQGGQRANHWALGLTNTYWVALGVWWFVFQQKRPGPPLPKGSSYATIGWKQIALALREIRHLPQTFLYLIAYFLLADGLNTTGTLICIIQNDQISFSFLQLTYLGITQATCSIASTMGLWYTQRHFRLRTKTLFMLTNAFTILIPFYGLVGLWTRRAGYHNMWEFYLYNVVFGLFQAPYYAYAQTMMSELTPQGYEGLFFGLFGTANRASSVLGPVVVQAIVNSTGSNWMGFPFLFVLCVVASAAVWAVDVDKGREDCRRFEEERKANQEADQVGSSRRGEH